VKRYEPTEMFIVRSVCNILSQGKERTL